MRLFPVRNKTKIGHSNKKLMKSVLRQKSLLEVIQSDPNANILALDINTVELDSLWMIIIRLTSTQYPNLTLFLPVYKHFWSSQGYHFQSMPHMNEEAIMMMHNLIPVLILKYRDNVKN